MAIGLVLVEPLPQPHEGLGAEVAAQQRLDGRAIEAGVAVRVQQALLAGQQRARAVDVDGAALQHKRRRVALDVQLAEQPLGNHRRSEEHTSELQSLMRISYAVFCLK